MADAPGPADAPGWSEASGSFEASGPPAAPGDGWREPARRFPLRWGSYGLRYVLGIVLALGGGLLVQLTSAYSLVALPVGLFVLVVGWCILPGIGWRRVIGATVGTFTAMLMLNGASSAVFLAAPLAAWLFLRERPLVSYPVLALPVLAAFALMQSFADYGWSGLVLTVSIAVLVGAAWLGRLLAAISRPRRPATR